MLIEETKLKHWIKNFYGYGSWNARIWFIGYEEGGGDVPEDVAERINYFFKHHSPGSKEMLCDIRELYREVSMRLDGPKAELFRTRYEYRFGPHAILHGVWKNLIAFSHGYRNKNLPDLLDYQKNNFLSPSEQDGTLIQLYPLPSPHNHAWYYSWLDLPQLPYLKSRTAYEEHIYQDRISRILSNIGIYKPEVVLMYGMTNINSLRNSIQRFFPDANFKLIKSIKRKIPQHHLAVLNGTLLILTTQIPALRHNRVDTGFEWEEFGKLVRNIAH